MNYSHRGPSSVSVLVTVLILCLSLSHTQLSYAMDQSPSSKGDPFVVPVKIDTYGKTWDGYLAFGLWDFNMSNFYVPMRSYLVVMTTDGQLLHLRETTGDQSYEPVRYLNYDTLMYEGEPENSTHFWNLKTNETTNFPNVSGHHDIIYNPLTNTFLTLTSYIREIDGKNVLMDEIVELDRSGNTLWTWDTYTNGHIDLSDNCQCNETNTVNGETVIDLTHGNSLQWNFQENMIYFNMRHLSTFCKIDRTTSKTIWCLGEHGNFTLLGTNGKPVPSLWYDAHDVHEIQPDVFLMFDNEYHNTSSAVPCPATFEEANASSRILEVTANEQNMTASVSWSWEGPRLDWSPYWGEADVLPNGDLIGTFGSESHYLPGSGITSPLSNSTGAVIVEVNQRGEVMRTYTFPYGWGIYRVVPIPLQTTNDYDYDASTHVSDLTVHLSSLNDIGGPTDIYYRTNDGPVKMVKVDGQPHITTEGFNTIEYWSVDGNGIEELPHNLLSGIKLIKVGRCGHIVCGDVGGQNENVKTLMGFIFIPDVLRVDALISVRAITLRDISTSGIWMFQERHSHETGSLKYRTSAHGKTILRAAGDTRCT